MTENRKGRGGNRDEVVKAIMYDLSFCSRSEFIHFNCISNLALGSNTIGLCETNLSTTGLLLQTLSYDI